MPFESIEAGIAHLHEQIRAELNKEENPVYIPLLGKHSALDTEEAADLEETVIRFTNSQKAVMVLYGDAGSGKSLFCRKLTLKLWDNYSHGKPIPLFIALPQLNDPIHQAVEETLSGNGFSQDQIAELKTNQDFIFIFDGYDELDKPHQFYNLYMTNGLSNWRSKTIITCRTQYFYNKKEPNVHFMPLQGERKRPHLLEIFYVTPFNQTQIALYLETLRERGIPIPDREEIGAIPGLESLMTTPFLLYLTIETLPDILVRYASIENTEAYQRLTQKTLYDAFIARWFLRQEEKLRAGKLITSDTLDLKPDFWRYSQELAVAMYQHNVTWVNPQDEHFQKFFENDERPLPRSACPLIKSGEVYSFWHQSLGTYFTAKAICEEVLMQSSLPDAAASETKEAVSQPVFQELPPVGDIHQHLITENIDQLRTIAGEIAEDPRLKESMFRIIECSKTDERYAIGAANAISALNLAKVPLTGMDFSHVKIRRANLSNAVVCQSNFSHADLRECDFHSADLSGSQFVEANLEGVDFGQLPYFDWRNGNVCSVCFSLDGRILIAGGSGGTIALFDVKNHELIKELRGHKDTVHHIAISPDGQHFVSSSRDCTIRLWNLNNYHSMLVRDFTGNESTMMRLCYDKAFPVVFSPDGEYIAFSEENFMGSYKLYIVPVSTSSRIPSVQPLASGMGRVSSIAYSTSRIAFCVERGYNNFSVELWNIGGEKIMLFEKSYLCSFSLDGRWLAMATLASNGHGICVYDVEQNQKTADLKKGAHTLKVLTFSPDSRILVSGGEDGLIFLWDVITHQGKMIASLIGHEQPITTCAFSSDSMFLASGTGQLELVGPDTGDHMIKLWDMQLLLMQTHDKQSYHASFDSHYGAINSITVFPQSGTIVSCGQDRRIKVWFSNNGSLDHTIVFPENTEICDEELVGCYALTTSKKALIVTRNQLKLLDVRTFQISHLFNRDPADTGYIVEAAVSPDERLAVIIKSRNSCVYDLHTGRLLYTCEGEFWKATFSGETLALAGNENGIVLFHTQNGTQEAHFPGNRSRIRDITFSPREALMASVQNTGSKLYLKFWNVDTKTCIDTFELKVEDIMKTRFSPDGHYLLVLSRSGKLLIWDAEKKRITNTYQISDTAETIHCGLEFLNAHCLITVAGDNFIKAWHFEEGRIQLQWRTGGELVLKDAMFENVFGLTDRNIKLLKQKSGRYLTPPVSRNQNTFFNDQSIQLLLKKYNLPDRSQASFEKGLRNAANNNQMDDLKIFLTLVQNVNAADNNPKFMRTALHWAACKGHNECYELLIQKAANPNLRDASNKTALEYKNEQQVVVPGK